MRLDMHWIRWLLLVPASVGAYIGVQLWSALCVGLAVGGTIVKLLSEARASQLFGTVLGPFTLVYAGAAVAPRHRLGAAIGLATLHALFAVSMVFCVTSMTGASA